MVQRMKFKRLLILCSTLSFLVTILLNIHLNISRKENSKWRFVFQYICYVQVEILYNFQLVQRACTSCNLYKQFVQVATRTRLAVQVVTCTEFHYQIDPTCKILLYKLELNKY